MKHSLFIFCFLAGFLFCQPCGNARKPEATQDVTPLRVLFLRDALPEEVLKQFTRETGIPVELVAERTGVDILTNLLAGEGASYFDLVEVGNYGVHQLASANLLQPLDPSLLPNARHLDPSFVNLPFDPQNRFTIPYQVVWTGLLVNPALAKSDVVHYADIFRPEWKDRIVVRNGTMGLFRWAAESVGVRDDKISPEGMAAVRPILEKWVSVMGPHMFDSKLEDLANGKAVAGAIYSGQAALLLRKNPALFWHVPPEDPMFYINLLAIPAGSTKYAQASKLINFLLRPDIAKQIEEKTGYMSPNLAARKLLPRAVLDNPASGLSPSEKSRLKLAPSFEEVADPAIGRAFVEIQTKVFPHPSDNPATDSQ